MVNILHFMWLSFTLYVTIGFINFYVSQTPNVLHRWYAYGKGLKSLERHAMYLSSVEVPKRWFAHFYIFAAIFVPCITGLSTLKYLNIYPCLMLNEFLTFFSSYYRQSEPTILPESVIIAGILLDLQVFRRLYECFYVSVFSDTKMNVMYYIIGYSFYFGIALSLIHDAPGFESGSNATAIFVSGQWFLWRHLIGIFLFTAGFLLQYDTTLTLAALRKKGDKVTYDHYMPAGRAFEYVSCPHYFAEIVMYLSVAVILGGRSYTWWLVCLWTTVNLTVAGVANHLWYRQKFKDYPAKRKAVIPFLL